MGGAHPHADRVFAAISSGEAAHSAIVASWSRSAQLFKLDVTRSRAPERLDPAEFRAARARIEPLLHAAAASLDDLFAAVGGVGCCVLLADRNGVPVERRGRSADDAVFSEWGLWTGTRWCEKTMGTNAIGTCLTLGRPTKVHRDQHFLARNTAMSCMSAPIHGADGNLAAVLDVSSARADLTEAFADLIAQTVAQTARRIEAETFRLAFPAARIVMVPGVERSAGALLAVDAHDLVVGASRGARRFLGLTGDIAASPRPASDLLGLGDAESLDGAERAAVVRALARAGGNVSAAARALGISRATLHRKLVRLRIDAAH
ncbi:MAG: Fis family transcriptional regulator [Alphaproteobacteria bacterium HGW-Alphaproteobacteria-4]|nr:MAG: Fis family transcriptional regulator [Alphaproteobacteria bacterium HGW-Alphaproteobacteria-4]